jgi:hypothetical protein
MDNSEKERLLAISVILLSSKLSNPNNTHTPQGLTAGCIRQASYLINCIFDDETLKEILNEHIL